MDKDKNDKKTTVNGTTVNGTMVNDIGQHNKDHECQPLPTYPKRVTSSGARSPDDFPVPGT
jgi:hypothetical protein